MLIKPGNLIEEEAAKGIRMSIVLRVPPGGRDVRQRTHGGLEHLVEAKMSREREVDEGRRRSGKTKPSRSSRLGLAR